jgi:hypothetical protein
MRFEHEHDTLHWPCGCAGWWYPPDEDNLRTWAHAADCPIGAEFDANERAEIVAEVRDRARFMLRESRAQLAREITEALAQGNDTP